MKGNLNNGAGLIFMSVLVILGIVIIIGLLGSYAFFSESGYMDYIYSTKTNLTATPYINTSVNGTQSLLIGAISRDIKGETKIETIQIYTENTDTTNRIVTVYLNSAVLGNITAINQSNTTTTFEDLNYVQNSKNTLLYVPVANVGEDLRVLNATGIYPSDNEDIKFDGIMDLLVAVLSICVMVILTMTIIFKK